MSQTAQALIANLRAQSEVGSITPASLADVLSQMMAEIRQAATSTLEGEFAFANLTGMTAEGAVETEIPVDSDSIAVNSLLEYATLGANAQSPLLTAKRDCLVQITGHITLQPIDSYAADRVIRFFKLDDEGERYADCIMTTHFTGATQIFNVPLNYSTILSPDQTIHLISYCSSNHGTRISANSHINIHVYPLNY